MLYDYAMLATPLILGVSEDGHRLTPEELGSLSRSLPSAMGNTLIAPFYRNLTGSPLPLGVVRLIDSYDQADIPGAVHTVLCQLWQDKVALTAERNRLLQEVSALRKDAEAAANMELKVEIARLKRYIEDNCKDSQNRIQTSGTHIFFNM
jgi:hypothetical protein